MTRHVEAMLAVLLTVGCGGGGGGRMEAANALAIEREVLAWQGRWKLAPGGLHITADPAGKDLAPRDAAAGSPVVGIDASGQVAWIGDGLETRTAPGAEPRLLRRTVLLERSRGGWQAVLAHDSFGVAGDEARRREEEGSWPPLADVGDGVTDDAQPLAQMVSQALGSADAFAALVSTRPGVLAFGPGPGDRMNGTHEVSELVRSLFVREGARLRRAGGMRGALTAGGGAGWIAANVDLIVSRGVRDFTRPCRMTAVFAREGEGWALVQLHLSHAVQD